MTLICFKMLSEQFFSKMKIYYVPNDVCYEIYKHQPFHTFIGARRLFAIAKELLIHISVLRPNPHEIVKLSQDLEYSLEHLASPESWLS